MTAYTKPDFAAMSGAQLITCYNEMVLTAQDIGLEGYKPRQVFHDKGDGLKRCEQLHSSIVARATGLHQADTQPDTGPVPTETTGSPGLDRLRAHPDAEKLRQKVLADQVTAATDAAVTHPQTQPTEAVTEESHVPTTKRKTKGTHNTAQRSKVTDANPNDSRIIMTITKYVGEENNPKRGTAAKRFALYKDDMTVAKYAKALENNNMGDIRQARADVNWDAKQGWIKLKQPQA